MVDYSKLANKLKENYTTTQIRNERICGQSLYYSIINNTADIKVSTLIKFCKLFQCKIDDLIDYTYK